MIKHIDYKNENSYPIAHTCFNRLELPKYPSEEIMRKFLKGIVLNDLEGIFGMEWNNIITLTYPNSLKLFPIIQIILTSIASEI